VLATGKRKREEVWFYKTNPESYESHWDIYSGGETWYCLGGKNNFFYAIALFFQHIKVNMGYRFEEYNYKDLINKLIT
jgi:hypothetical protein